MYAEISDSLDYIEFGRLCGMFPCKSKTIYQVSKILLNEDNSKFSKYFLHNNITLNKIKRSIQKCSIIATDFFLESVIFRNIKDKTFSCTAENN